MKSLSGQCRLAILSISFVSFLLFIATGSSVLAHEGTLHPDGRMSEHMQSMLAVKKKIPEEYRIMERTPIFPAEESLRQGEKLFLQNCSVCHGEKGDGKGPAAAALKPPPANFLERKHSAIYSPGEKYWIINKGTGETGMPAFPQLTPVDRWHLVNHILHLQQESSGTEETHGHR